MRRKHRAECPVTALAAWLWAVVLIPLARPAAAAEVPFVIDTSRLVEVHSVEGLPMDVKRMLGRQKAGVEGLADKWEPFNKTDVIDARLPMRRFTTGGAGPSSALLAYEQGGRGYSVHAAAFYAELQKLNDRFPLCANSQADRGDR